MKTGTILLRISICILVLAAALTAAPLQALSTEVFGGSAVSDITIHDGILWAATGKGVLRLDSTSGEQRLFTTDDGLLDNSIATVAVSRIGDVWAGSNKGVARLNGDTWTKMTLPANQSLAETMRIVFAPKGNIWICTPVIQYQYNGLIWLSWALENVQRYATFFDIDVTADGTAWFGTMMGVLSYKEYAWSNYTADPTGPGLTEINAIAAAQDGAAVWCGTNNAIYRLENGVWTQFGQEGLYGPRVLELAVDRSGVVWASTAGQESGVSRFIDGSWRRVIPASETGGSAPVCIEFGNGQDMWAGSSAGLFRFELAALSVKDSGEIPRMTSIIGNYPNPFNPETVIYYEVPESAGLTRLSIFNLTGQRIRSLVNSVLDAGAHSILWDGRDDTGAPVASGMYLASLTAGNHRVSHRMTLLR